MIYKYNYGTHNIFDAMVIYDYILANDNLENIELKDIVECLDSIYVSNNTRCIIGLRRVNSDSSIVKEFSYYCKPDSICYEIVFLHIQEINEKTEEVLKDLVRTATLDKNDAYILHRISCPELVTEAGKRALTSIGYEYVENDKACIKDPYVYGDKFK